VEGDTLIAADLKLHLTSLTVERGQVTMQLSVREFQMMEYLMRHPHQVLSRANQTWEWGTEPESNAVTTLVRRLQRFRQLELKIVETVYGMGYRLNQ